MSAPAASTVLDLSEEKLNSASFLYQLVPQEVTLDNAIPLLILPTGTQDIVKIDVITDAGEWSAERSLVAKMTNSMLRKGNAAHTAQELAEIFDFYGAFLSNGAEKDRSGYTLFSLNRHLKNTIPLFASLFESPTFNSNELALLCQNKKQEFVVNQSRAAYVAATQFNALIFGETHPYGRVVKESDFDEITPELLNQFFKSKYIPKQMKIIASGKITDELVSLLNSTFGQLKNGADLSVQKTFTTPENAPSKRHISVGNGLQTGIRMGAQMITHNHPDFNKLSIANTLLGGYFGSRLMKNIREEKGLTYGIGSLLYSFIHEGIFLITTQVNAENSERAIEEILKEVELVRSETASIEELQLVKNYISGQFIRSIDGLFALSDTFRALHDANMGRSEVIENLRTLRDITPEEIMELAHKYLNPTNFSIVTAGK